MAKDSFSFKQFTVRHDRCAMKVGTDGVLIGAWANITGCNRVLDIGTGTGLIALMIAQRSNAWIDAIDIDKEAYLQATENTQNSIFHDRIEVMQASFDRFVPPHNRKYDLIISNPPYFTSSLKGPDKQRNQARHDDGLTLELLIENAIPLLSPLGIISLILPFDKREEIHILAKCHTLSIVRETHVLPKATSIPKRVLIELSGNSPTATIQEELVIETARHQYTEEYCALTRPFYLKM